MGPDGPGESTDRSERFEERPDGLLEYDGVLIDPGDQLIGEQVHRLLKAGWYERQEAEMVRRHLPSDVDVVELGAGLGYISCVIDAVLSPSRTHVAVEPNPEILPLLEKTKELNGAGYIVEEGGYGATSDTVRLDVGGDYWSGRTQPGGCCDTTPTVTLQELRTRHDITTFSLVMDIEGAEYELLLSELELLEAHCPLLIVEFHESGLQAGEYGDEIDDSDFVLVDGLEEVCVYRNERFESDPDLGF